MAPKRVLRDDRRAERDEETRRVRARLETHEEQIEGLGVTTRQHDLRLQYLESPYKWVTRGFTSTQAFLDTKDENFKAAKATFLTDFLAELHNSTPGMVEAHVAELEGLLLEEEGVVLIGVFPTGGWLNQLPDCSVRFQQGFSGLRVGFLLRLISQSLREPLVLHQERPRVRHAKGKGKGAPPQDKGRGKGKRAEGKGGKGGKPAAKAAAAPLIPGQHA